MRELVTQHRATSIALKAKSADLVELRRDSVTYPRIKDYDKGLLQQELKALILMVYQYRGQRPENSQEVNTMAQCLFNEILADDFGDNLMELTMEEIRRALRKAALGKGKEMYGINVRSLYDAIADFRHSEVEMAWSQIKQEQNNEQKEGYTTREMVTEKYAAMMESAMKERSGA